MQIDTCRIPVLEYVDRVPTNMYMYVGTKCQLVRSQGKGIESNGVACVVILCGTNVVKPPHLQPRFH